MDTTHKKGSKHNRGGWLKDPRKARPEETIGGGYFVFRRGDGTGRIRPSMFPFEYATLDAAKEQAGRLAIANPGERFEVFATTHHVVMHVPGVAEAHAA